MERLSTEKARVDLSENSHIAEAELVERAREGDLAAFELLYRRYAGRIHGLCLRMVRDRERAQDITQDAFVRAWQKLGSFRGESAFGTWLHRLAVNVALGDIRSRRRWESKTEDSEAMPELGTAPVRREMGIDLARAVDRLPPKARTIFLLYDVEGYRHGEIASLVGVAEGTSKAHLHRARKILREALAR